MTITVSGVGTVDLPFNSGRVLLILLRLLIFWLSSGRSLGFCSPLFLLRLGIYCRVVFRTASWSLIQGWGPNPTFASIAALSCSVRLPYFIYKVPDSSLHHDLLVFKLGD